MQHLVQRVSFGILLSCVLLCGRTARAGQYTVTYSGGSYTQSPGTGGNDGAVTNGWGFGANATGGYGSASISGSGQITATFTWVPNPNLPSGSDPAPASAIVTEECSASAGGYGYNSQPSASASDGFGDPFQITEQNSTVLYGTSSGFRYSVQSGNTFSVSCSPTLSTSGTMCDLSANITYSASASPVTVSVSGTTPVSQSGVQVAGALIGQGLTVSLNTGNMTQSNWSWSITGDPFAGFQVNGNTGGPVALSPATLQSSGFTYYYRSIQGAGPAMSTITCTATITDPKNQQHQATGTAQVYVYKPTYTFNDSPGTMGWFVNTIQVNGQNVNVPVFGAGGDPQYQRGISWIASVLTPSQFVGENGIGVYGYVQIATISGSSIVNGAPFHDSNNGQTGLDSGVPFLGWTSPADGNEYNIGDSPNYALRTGMTSITMGHTFKTYMVYQPAPYNSGGPTTWVPLWEIDWGASGTGTFDPVAMTFSVMPGAAVTVTSSQASTVLPSWTQAIAPGTWVAGN